MQQASCRRLAQQATVLVEVVAAIGEHPLGPVPRAAPQSAYARDRVEQGNQLCDVVTVVRETASGIPWLPTIT